nr:integrase, catalytic region, zinc finger, CCHC-type, peptidase aspartic, catalytic [Tanacetum cinerariifolium]
MLNNENYVPWSSCIIRYARSRPNGKMIVDSIENGPYVRRMIATSGEPDLLVPVPESFHEQTDEELTETDIKRMDADDQAIQTILLGLPKDVYAADKKAKLFNEWKKFTSTDGESIESYYHRFMQLMNDLKRNKHFQEKIASNLKFLNNLQPEWKTHVTIVRQTKNLHETDFTQIYDFLKMNQEEVNELRAECLAKSHDPLALMAHSQNSFNFPTTHNDQSSSSTHSQQPFPIKNKYNPQPLLNQSFMQPLMTSLEDINDPTEAMNAALTLFAKAFQLSAPTNNNQRTLSNPRNLVQNQQGFNAWQNGGIQGAQNAGVQSGGNQNGLFVVPGIVNQSGTGNVVAARAEGTGNGNQARCYNYRGLGHIARNCTARPRRRDLLIAQKEESGIQLQAKEFDFMAAVGDLDEIEEVNANCILMANLQQVSTSGLSHDLFSMGQFCDDDLEVAFRRKTCFIRDLDGVDCLKGNHSTNLYTINLYDMASASPICLMARVTPTKSWLWHQRLSHLNFDTINDLAKNDLISDLPKFKYAKEHLCPSYEQGKSKEPHTHPNRFRIQSSGFICFIWICVVQCELQALMVNVLKEYFDSVGITHENSAAKTPQQNGVVERINRTLVEAARTMLIFSHALLFLWAEAIATASRLGLQSMTFGQISFELELTYAPSTITPQRPSECDLYILFKPLHNEYLGGRPTEAPRVIPATPVLQNLQAPTASMSFQDSAPAPKNSLNTPVSSYNVDATSPQCAQQQRNHTPSPTASAADNVSNAGFEGDLFVNPFGTPSTDQNQRDLPKDTLIDRLEVLRTQSSKVLEPSHTVKSRNNSRVIRIILVIMPEHQSDIFEIFTVTMEILLEPTSNKLLVGDVGDSIWIELVTLDINLGPE